MHIFILRHGIAAEPDPDRYPDDDRPLTGEGIEKMELAADSFRQLIGKVDSIFSSPLLRALDTAKIAAAGLGFQGQIQIQKLLLPEAPIGSLISYLGSLPSNGTFLLVGHEPCLGYLASSLLGSERCIINIKKGSLCYIELAGTPGLMPGVLKWHLTSKHLRLIGA